MNPIDALAQIDAHHEAAMANLHPIQAALDVGDTWVRFANLDADPPFVEFGIVRGVRNGDLLESYVHSTVTPRGVGSYITRDLVWPIGTLLWHAALKAEWNINRLDENGRGLLNIAFAGMKAHYLVSHNADPAPTREAVRAAISNAYYDARNAGQTMETAANLAADAVMDLLP